MWLQPFHAHSRAQPAAQLQDKPACPWGSPRAGPAGTPAAPASQRACFDPKGQGWDRLPGSVGPGLQGGGSRTEQQSRVPGGQGGEPGSGRSALSTGEGRRAERGEHGDAVQQREPRLRGHAGRRVPGGAVCRGGGHVLGWQPCVRMAAVCQGGGRVPGSCRRLRPERPPRRPQAKPSRPPDTGHRCAAKRRQAPS